MKKISEMELCVWLNSIGGIGTIKQHFLLNYFGTIEKLLGAKDEDFYKIEGISVKEIDSLHSAMNDEYIDKHVISVLDKTQKCGARYVYYDDAEYPARLKEIYDYPLGLFVKGNLPYEFLPKVAIVGARNCSDYGASVAYVIAKQLSNLDVEIISGFARGIDINAHEGALKGNGNTYAVMGCGIDICYPMANIDLYDKVIERGGFISEYPPGVKGIAYNFPMRNRIISGLSDLVLVVEAQKKSGSLITANLALDYGREVCAVPGRINDEMSLGCNNLIKNGARLVGSADDIVEELEMMGYLLRDNLNHIGIEYGTKSSKDFLKSKFALASSEKIVYDFLCLQPKHMEEIVNFTGLLSSEVSSILVKLELLGLIEQPGKNYYVRV